MLTNRRAFRLTPVTVATLLIACHLPAKVSAANWTAKATSMLQSLVAAAHDRADSIRANNRGGHASDRHDKLSLFIDSMERRWVHPWDANVEKNFLTVLANQQTLARAMQRMARDIRSEALRSGVKEENAPPGRCIDPVYAGNPDYDACTAVLRSKLVAVQNNRTTLIKEG